MKPLLISLLCPVLLLSSGGVAAVTDVNGTLGKSVVFQVSVPAPTNSLITWTINTVQVAQYIPSFPPDCSNQLSGRCKLYTNGSLRIDNVSYNDEGAYALAVRAPGSPGTTTTNYQLRVYAPLNAPTLSTSNVLSLTGYVAVSNVAVTSNVSGLVWPGLDSVSLRCAAQGTNVSYSWSLQGAPISGGGRYTLTDNNATLIISPVSTDDNGSFVCTADNVINSQNSSDVRLNLASPVSAVALTTFSSAVLWAGEDFAHLFCSAEGSDITFSWSLNGTQLSSNYSYHIIQNDSSPYSNLFIIPVSRNDTGLFTCKATNRANSKTSNAANLNINWSPNRNIFCLVKLINEVVQLGCSWHGGNPAANVTMIFGDVQNTSPNEVYRNVTFSDPVNRSNLTCNGDQLGRTSSCVVLFEPPTSPDNRNNTISRVVVGGAVNLTVDLQFGILSRASTAIAPVFPASFSWFQGSNPSFIQNGGKFNVTTTPFASTLNIDKLSEAEFGEYKCVVVNVIGSTTFVFNVKESQSGVSSSQVDDGTIAAIVLVVLGGVILIGAITFFILRKPPLSAPVLRSVTSSLLINGTNVTLQCDAGNQNVTSYTFYRDDQKIICSDRVICRGSSLDFTPIYKDDSGSYTCAIQNPVSTNTSNVLSLTVYVPVSNVAVTSNVSRLVWPGLDSASLRCSATGTNVSYSWSLQGAPIFGEGQYTLTDNNATLIISPVSTDDNGSFVCTADNVINSQNSSDVRLNLAAPVSAVALTSNASAVLWAGQDSVSLHCSAQGSAITFSWSLNGNQVSSKSPYYITQSDSPPNSNLTISPVSKTDTGPFTCKATNRENNITSDVTNLNINWFPDGDIACTAQPINQTVQLGCSWPGGKPAANVSLRFTDLQESSPNEVYSNVNYSSDIYGRNLFCNGDQLGRTSNCSLAFEPPTSPAHNNNTTTPAVVGGAVNLTVDLQPGSQSRASTVSAQALPATFSWFRGNSSSSIPNGGKFFVNSTPYTSTLNIDTLTEAESGEYKCVATNFIGNTTFLFNVKVSQSGGSSHGLDGGAIAGIVIGTVAGVALLGVIAFFIFKKRIFKRKTQEAIYEEPDSRSENIYAKSIPGTAPQLDRAQPRKKEPDYQNVIHGNPEYYNVMSGSRK